MAMNGFANPCCCSSTMQAHGCVREAADSTFWSLSSNLSHVEEAVSFFWATKLLSAIALATFSFSSLFTS